MLWLLLVMAALWLGGKALGLSAPRRLLLVALAWAFGLVTLLRALDGSGPPERDAVAWALLAPLAAALWLYSGWISRLKAKVAQTERSKTVQEAQSATVQAPAPQPPTASSSNAQAPINSQPALSEPPLSASPMVKTAMTSDTLTPPELERYSRHILLREVGGPGQMRIRRAKVLVIGAGGLGAPVLQYLAAAGIGTLAVIDDDTVDGSNLHRQVIHDEADIGKAKVVSAAERLHAQNPHVTVLPLQQRLDASQAAALFADYDLIIDGTDNFDTRYLANRAAVAAGKPLLSGALTQWEGQVTLLDPSRGGPCYECIFPDRPAEGLVPACSVAGVIGPLPGIIGALMATEAVKLLTGAGEPLRGRLLIWDALEAEMREIRIKPRPNCPVCGGLHHGAHA